MSLQRSSSAPHTVATLVGPTQGQKLARTKSHMHMEKADKRLFLKPLVAAVASPLASAGGEREDPFNLLGFFPPSDEKESWRWLHKEEAVEEEDGEAVVEESGGPGETVEEVIKGEDKLGVLGLSLFEHREWGGEERLLSPYVMEDAGEWDGLYQRFRQRRQTRTGETPGPEEAGFSALFFP